MCIGFFIIIIFRFVKVVTIHIVILIIVSTVLWIIFFVILQIINIAVVWVVLFVNIAIVWVVILIVILQFIRAVTTNIEGFFIPPFVSDIAISVLLPVVVLFVLVVLKFVNNAEKGQ